MATERTAEDLRLRSARQIDIAKGVARRMFAARGNHSEIHLKEMELAAIIAATVRVVEEDEAGMGPATKGETNWRMNQAETCRKNTTGCWRR